MSEHKHVSERLTLGPTKLVVHYIALYLLLTIIYRCFGQVNVDPSLLLAKFVITRKLSWHSLFILIFTDGLKFLIKQIHNLPRLIISGQAPYVPEVSSPYDTCNFDVDDSDFRPNVSLSYIHVLIFTVRNRACFLMMSGFIEYGI